METYADFLYARPSLWEGWARILDLAGTLNEYNYSKDDQAADALALAMDWKAVGAAIGKAANELVASGDIHAKEE